MGDADDMQGFLDRVDEINRLVRGVKDGEAGAIGKADEYLGREGGGKGGFSRTVISKPPPMDPEIAAAPPEQRAFMLQVRQDAEERRRRKQEGAAAAAVLKDEGNAAFGAGRWEEAVGLYTRALQSESDNKVLYANRAAAYIKLGKHQDALDSTRWALELDPSYLKAQLRRGRALTELARFDDALDTYQHALRLCRGDQKRFQPEVRRCLAEASLRKTLGEEDETVAVAETGSDTDRGTVQVVRECLAAIGTLAPDIEAWTRLSGLLRDTALARPACRHHGGLGLLATVAGLATAHAGLEPGSPSEAGACKALDLLRTLCSESETASFALAVLPQAAEHGAGVAACGSAALRTGLWHLLAGSCRGTDSLARQVWAGSQLADDGLAALGDNGRGWPEREAAASFLGLLCAESAFRSRHKGRFEERLIPSLEVLMLAASLGPQEAEGAMSACLNAFINLSCDERCRAVLVRRSLDKFLGAAKVLTAAAVTASQPSTALPALLGLLTSLALVDTAAQALVDEALLENLTLVCRVGSTATLEGRARALALLARLGSCPGAIHSLVRMGALKRLKKLARSSSEAPVLEPLARLLAKCAQESEEARRQLFTSKGVATILHLVSSPNAVVCGNMALCLASCCQHATLCERLVGTDIVERLLAVCKAGRSAHQENASIALARLCTGCQTHLARLRELGGLAVLQARLPPGS